jgi:hypothetical protein
MAAGIGLAIAGGAKLTQSVLKGFNLKNQYKIQQYQLQTQKKAIQANAANAELQRLTNLNSILSTQRAVFASRGQTAGFGSAMVIQQESINQAAIEQQNANLQQKLEESVLDYNIASAKRASSGAIFSSVLSGALEFAGQVGSSMAGASFSGGGGGQ